jgi:hypothetical protein
MWKPIPCKVKACTMFASSSFNEKGGGIPGSTGLKKWVPV